LRHRQRRQGFNGNPRVQFDTERIKDLRSPQIIQLGKFPALQTLIGLDFLLELQVEGFNGIDDPLDLADGS
jgi:hypothetical protein